MAGTLTNGRQQTRTGGKSLRSGKAWLISSSLADKLSWMVGSRWKQSKLQRFLHPATSFRVHFLSINFETRNFQCQQLRVDSSRNRFVLLETAQLVKHEIEIKFTCSCGEWPRLDGKQLRQQFGRFGVADRARFVVEVLDLHIRAFLGVEFSTSEVAKMHSRLQSRANHSELN